MHILIKRWRSVNKVTFSLTSNQRLGNKVHNCKMAYSKGNRLSRNPEWLRKLWRCIFKYPNDKVNNTIISSFNSESRCMILLDKVLWRKVGHFALMLDHLQYIICVLISMLYRYDTCQFQISVVSSNYYGNAKWWRN